MSEASSLIEALKTVANAYGAATSRSPSRVSTLVFGDGTKLPAIVDRGADLTTGRFERAMQWFSDNWPDAAAWPEGIERPAKAESAA